MGGSKLHQFFLSGAGDVSISEVLSDTYIGVDASWMMQNYLQHYQVIYARVNAPAPCASLFNDWITSKRRTFLRSWCSTVSARRVSATRLFAAIKAAGLEEHAHSNIYIYSCIARP